MNNQQLLFHFIFFWIVVINFGLPGLPVPENARAAQSPVVFPDHPDPFLQYGFEVSGFTAAQEEIIRKTLAAYAIALGGSEQLKKIITSYHDGKNWTITYDPNGVGAYSNMKLTPTVFSLEKAKAVNYHSFCTSSEEVHSQIVIGHEVGHLLVRAARAQTGVNWITSYELQVERDWQRINSSKASEEEAVTELSLKVLKVGYYLDLDGDQIEANPQMVAGIGGWVTSFLRSLKQM